jgi:SET domain-containing protein
MDYRGAVMRWSEATRRYQHSTAEDGHTFFFDLGDGLVIDGGQGGNSSRWINHGCDPNCEAVVEGRKVVIRAVRDLAAGDELLLDYQLQLDADAGDDEKAPYGCRCGAPGCRSTMLAIVSP